MNVVDLNAVRQQREIETLRAHISELHCVLSQLRRENSSLKELLNRRAIGTRIRGWFGIEV